MSIDREQHSDVQERSVEDLTERRASHRRPAQIKTTIFREHDVVGHGTAARLTDVSATGLGLKISVAPPELDESIKIRLQDEIRQFDKELRGCVRNLLPTDDGSHHIGIELVTRLTLPEVSLLRTSELVGAETDWV